MPPVKFLGINLVSELRKFFLEDALPDRPFLWPAVDLSRDDLWQVSEATSFRLERKMSGPRFLEIARGVISQCGVDVKAATATKFNRFRRFLPTGVQVLNLHPQECQAIGSWVEMPEQEAPPLLRQWAARTSCLLITQVSVSWLACVPNPLLCKQCCNMRWQCRCHTRRCLPTPLGGRVFRVLGLAPPQLLQMARKICRFPVPALPKFRNLRHPQRTREAPPRRIPHTSVSWMRLRGLDSVRRFML